MARALCSITGCGRESSARGWCSAHYKRWRRNGHPEAYKAYPDATMALDARTVSEGDCLVWTGAKNAQGYGVTGRRAGSRLAHRHAWERENGPIPEGMHVDHICHNPACVKVPHLRLATFATNAYNRAGQQSNHKSTGVRNVYPNKKGFMVRVVKGGENHYGGTWPTVEEAARVASRMRAELFGEFAGHARKRYSDTPGITIHAIREDKP